MSLIVIYSLYRQIILSDYFGARSILKHDQAIWGTPNPTPQELQNSSMHNPQPLKQLPILPAQVGVWLCVQMNLIPVA